MESIPLSDGEIAALHELRAHHTDARIALIGAAALRLAVPTARTTLDLDVTISVGLDALTSKAMAPPSWRPDGRLEHRWRTSLGTWIDLLPASPDLISKRQVEWPRSGMVMSLVGFRHLFSAPEIEIAPGLRVHVAEPHLILLLKMVAYLDRPAERGKDLTDIAMLFEELLIPGADEWLAANESLIEAGIEQEQVSAFALGNRLGPMLDDEERELVKRFMEKMRPTAPVGSPLLSRAPSRWKRVDGELDRMLTAFDVGLDFHRRSRD